LNTRTGLVVSLFIIAMPVMGQQIESRPDTPPATQDTQPASTEAGQTQKRLKISTNSIALNQVAKGDGSGTGITDSAISEVGGNVGIGTTNPAARLHISGLATHDLFASMGPNPSGGPSFNFGYGGNSFGEGAGFFNVRPDSDAVAPNPSLRFLTANVQRMIITNTGAIAIGLPLPAPGKILHVSGDAQFDGTVTGTNIRANYQDVAEWVPSAEDLSPGTVVVIDKRSGNTVKASTASYDTSVAGVVSSQPGIVLGEEGSSREQIATTGRVRVHVDASKGAIGIGDLLVTSDVPGTAMKSAPIDIGGFSIHRPGTIIGKALEPLDHGVGEILVLLSLQ
jgi:hypothetical protein